MYGKRGRNKSARGCYEWAFEKAWTGAKTSDPSCMKPPTVVCNTMVCADEPEVAKGMAISLGLSSTHCRRTQG